MTEALFSQANGNEFYFCFRLCNAYKKQTRTRPCQTLLRVLGMQILQP